MPGKKLKEFLDARSVKYTSFEHPIEFTAQEIAAAAHVKGQEMAKTIIVKLDGVMAMAVLPASHHVDLERLKKAAAVHVAVLATEDEFKKLFPDCQPGAMPPFGNLYGMQVYVSDALSRDREITFNAGTYSEMVRMAFADFVELVHPVLADFSFNPEQRAAA